MNLHPSEALKYLDKLFSLIFICLCRLTLSQDLKQTYGALAKSLFPQDCQPNFADSRCLESLDNHHNFWTPI